MFDTPDLTPLYFGALIAVIVGFMVLVHGPTIEQNLSRGGTRLHSCTFWVFLTLMVMPIVCFASTSVIYTVTTLLREPHGCFPPKGFSEADLIGTWNAVGSRGNNMLIIRENHKYKQVLHVDWQKFDYEGDWLPWRLTFSEEGLPYLHLEGLVMCAYWDEVDCTTGQSRLGSHELEGTVDIWGNATYWFDFCREYWVDTHGEAVLIVLGVPARFTQPPRGIDLATLSKSDMPTGPTYELLEP